MPSFKDASRRSFLGLAAAALFTLGLGTGTVQAAEGWPKGPITIIVPFNAGGSADRMARTLADPMSKELGVPVVVENRPGGAGGLGATYLIQQPADGNTLLLMQATPYLANAILVGGAPVKWEDFSLLNAQWNDYAIWAVHNDSPYETFDQLVEAMKEPGTVSSGIIYGNGGHLQTILAMNALDIPVENVRFVTYDGGAPLRTALAGNQVDFEVLAARGAASIMDSLKVLAIVNDNDPDSMGAPLLNDALVALGAEKQPIIGGNISGLIVPSALKDEHPDRYEALLDAYKKVVTSDAYKAAAREAGVGSDWIGPEASQEMVDGAYGALSELSGVIN
ncbi:tripartite tricarboxylate transporter substrate binding protein [Stappia sp. ES.058]|uniref:Bug family tripartite tricarboxylate transporter substrate binding protein n=1 Tax=Stappia sp. ES.058 TaxID=1881061 RepID=UPI000879FD99|nr:tripartite tricarboxylate transporter substrate binding protein [Stappia sp. ES.058]SDT87944.1 Tripartite-type tricarboxylate transporter, receptor component TctC [Stappia sp. ES.058]SDU49595.1 Tripartite-type tricarboxylate transporter, receptor component TctC [Stappia sp. ES.058]